MKKALISTCLCLLLAVQVSGCGKKSNPVYRDADGKVVQSHKTPPPYGAQVQE